MGGRILIMKIFNELKALIILAFCLGSVFVVKTQSLTPLLIINSFFLIGLGFYIRDLKLGLSKFIYYILISCLNVFTMFFVIQYLYRGEIESLFLAKIFKFLTASSMPLFYGVWLFILSIGLMFLQKIGGGESGR